MAPFDYNSKADLFLCRSKMARPRPLEYIPFAVASDAVRFVMEELPPQRFGGMCMEVDERRFDLDAIRKLYESPAYPFARKRTAGEAARPARKRPASLE